MNCPGRQFYTQSKVHSGIVRVGQFVHTEKSFLNLVHRNQNMDFNYHFSKDLAPNEIPFGGKSIGGKVIAILYTYMY